MKKNILMRKFVGEFAENKDIAKKMRVEKVMPTLSKRGEVIFDFDGVGGATQSFIHALVSDPIRKFGSTAFNNLFYKNANDDIQEIISIVYRYMQESLDSKNHEE
ncbi:MAG: STAS-like domain-containing protein [Candidatus Saccharimonadaceae bacterium]|nr:STAS-like domain-containing protein [Candidatus Saccharimonadaceae bacterium]